MSTSHSSGQSSAPSSGRRIVPPVPVQVVLNAPPLPGVVKRKRRRSLKPVIVSLAVAALLAGGGWIGWRIFKVNQRLSAMQQLINKMELAQQDALRANGWEGGDMVNGVNYVVTSPRSDDPFIAEFTDSLKSKVGVLVVMVNNQHTQSAHTLDVALATVHLKDGSTLPGPDRQTLLRACANPVAADAYPAVYQVPAGDLAWGKPVFIPPDVDVTQLEAVTLTIDGKECKLPGRFLSAADKMKLRVDEYEKREAERAQLKRQATTEKS